MRVFWAVIGVLMIAASAYLLMGKQDSARLPVTASSREPAPVPAAPATVVRDPIPTAAEPVPETKAPSVPEPPKAASGAEPPRDPLAQQTPLQTPLQTPQPAPQQGSPAGTAAIPPSPTPSDPPKPSAPVAEPTTTATPATTPNFLESLKPPAEPPSAPAAAPPPVKIETKADGNLIVDGKYLVKGKGTQEEPYQVTWDHLISAQDDYVPRNGQTELPGRVTMLSGKWVEITGNIAFPIMAETQEDCLAMLNQWDGCCIGIPPTPYDAVEVRLKTAIEGQDRLTTYGVVRGKFTVEPQLVGGWLIGLYLMDQATLTPQAFGGFAP